MLQGFDALGDYPDAKRLAYVYNGFDQMPLADDLDDRLYELPVDLQTARLELQEADDRRVARTEIVDLDVDAEFLELIDIPTDNLVRFIQENRIPAVRMIASQA